MSYQSSPPQFTNLVNQIPIQLVSIFESQAWRRYLPYGTKILSGLRSKFLPPSRSKGRLHRVDPGRHLHRKVINFLFCTPNFLRSKSWVQRMTTRTVRTFPSFSRYSRPLTRLRARNGELGISSRKGSPISTTLDIFLMTFANVDSGCDLSLCLKNLLSSSQSSSQGGL